MPTFLFPTRHKLVPGTALLCFQHYSVGKVKGQKLISCDVFGVSGSSG